LNSEPFTQNSPPYEGEVARAAQAEWFSLAANIFRRDILRFEYFVIDL
jgi:hypothetical protein